MERIGDRRAPAWSHQAAGLFAGLSLPMRVGVAIVDDGVRLAASW